MKIQERSKLYQRIFAWALSRGMGSYEAWMAERKSRLLTGLSGKVLEIGPGAGVNFSYYLPDVQWVGAEPNPFLHPYLRAKASETNLKIDLQACSAEALAVPDESVDAVVGTLVLCSVDQVHQVLREILRVLRPGGRYCFIEHVAAPRGTRLRRIQRWLRPLWQIVLDGCRPDQDTLALIRAAGFSQVDCEQFSGPLPIVRPHIAGIAFKGTKLEDQMTLAGSDSSSR